MNPRTRCLALSLCAGVAFSGTALAQQPSLTIQPLNSGTDPIMLSGSGTQGVRPRTRFWDFPDVYTPMVTSMDALQSSPDGQFALGRSTLESRAARLSRSSGLTIFPNATTGLVPHTAYASSSGGSPAVGYGFLGGSTQAFMWTTGGGTQDLGLRLGDRSSVLVDVSSGGSVAAGWGEPVSTGSRHPLRYENGQGFSRLSRTGGGLLTGGEAKAVSSNGNVIVGLHTVGSTVRGFRWTVSGGHIDLPSPANPSSTTLETRAFDVSADGAWTVGEATAGTGSTIATIWDATGTPYALADLLGDNPQLAVFELRTIASVSDNGRTVSGMGFDYAAGQIRAFVATWSLTTTPGDCQPDLGIAGGQSGQDGNLDNNDFIVFIDSFFEANAASDFGSAGGVSGPDGVFDNNDFIAFIDAFFVGCAG